MVDIFKVGGFCNWIKNNIFLYNNRYSLRDKLGFLLVDTTRSIIVVNLLLNIN